MYIFLLVLIPTVFWGNSPEETASYLGYLTLIPPILSILLSFVTKRVYFSLALGIWSGALLLFIKEGFIVADIYHSFEKVISIIITVLSDSWSATIIAQIVTIGGMIAVISKNGGAYAVAEAIAKKAKTARSAQIFTCFTALFIFFDDYANCLITGPVMKPVTDKLKISREKLSFLVDATAAPIAGVALISTWIGYELGILKDAYIIAGIENPNPYIIFIETLPYRFYNFFMLGFLLLIALLNKDYGPMLKAEQLARQKGIINSSHLEIKDESLTPEHQNNYKLSNALVPLSVLIFGTFLGIWYDGYRGLVANNINLSALSGYEYMLAILGACDVITVIFKSSVLASITAMSVSAWNKSLSFFESIDAWIAGAKHLMGTVIILTLAWSISSIIKELGTSYYLVQLLQHNIPAVSLPAIIFILATLIAFSTGTSYGTMGILMPLAVPLAASLSGDVNSHITIMTAGSVLTGAIVGDHCSPISDTTVLSASGADCPLISHVDTQLPYVITVTIVSLICGYFLVVFGAPIILSYILGFIILAMTIYFIGKNPEIHPIDDENN